MIFTRFYFSLSVLAIAASCSLEKLQDETTVSQESGDGDISVTNVCNTGNPTAYEISFLNLPEAKVINKLGEEKEITVFVDTGQNFSSSTVNLSIERDELDAVDTNDQIDISFSPSTFSIGPCESRQVTLRVNSDYLSKPFDDHFHVVADAGSANVTRPIDFATAGEIDIRIMGGSPEIWRDVNGRTFTGTSFNSNFPGGVQIRFFQNDQAGLTRVHSGAELFPHQPEPPMGIYTGGEPDFYEVTVSQGDTGSNETYCHEHEGGGQNRPLIAVNVN